MNANWFTANVNIEAHARCYIAAVTVAETRAIVAFKGTADVNNLSV